MTLGGKPAGTSDSYRQATFSSSSFICYPNVVFLPLPSPSTSSRKFNKYRSWPHLITRPPLASASPHGTLLLFLSLLFSAAPFQWLFPPDSGVAGLLMLCCLCYISLHAIVGWRTNAPFPFVAHPSDHPAPKARVCNTFDRQVGNN